MNVGVYTCVYVAVYVAMEESVDGRCLNTLFPSSLWREIMYIHVGQQL